MILTKYTPRAREYRRIPYKRRLVTSWPISLLWVFLSLSLAVLSTFSFLQADWVVKRDLIVTRFFTSSRNGTLLGLDEAGVEENSEFNDTTTKIEIPNEEFSKYLRKYTSIEFENETIFYDSNHNRVAKLTKVVTTVRFGLIGVCTSPSSGTIQCFLYESSKSEDRHTISSIWPMLTLVGGSGCVCLCVCAVLSLLALALPSSQMRHQAAKTIGHAQTVAVVLLMLSLLGFPLGFTSPFVRHHCGAATGWYTPGDCEIGWAYALVLVSTSLSLYCPVLVQFTAEFRYGHLPKYL